MPTLINKQAGMLEPEPEKDADQSMDYSFALEYTGPRPEYVPRAQPLRVRNNGGFSQASSDANNIHDSSEPSGELHVQSMDQMEKISPSNDSQSEVDMPFPGRGDETSTRSDFRFSGPHSSSFQTGNSSSNGFSQDQNALSQQRHPSKTPLRKSKCYKCLKSLRLQDKETCLVCNARYCFSCVLNAMGSMPEGRKCVSCVGKPIDESNRSRLGKASKLLNNLLNPLEVYNIMKTESESMANQICPEQVYVNETQLTSRDLDKLLGCKNPPCRLVPGHYWYDSQCGYWGKMGDKPSHIITPSLPIGGELCENASNGCTKVYINGREITKTELKMLKLSGVQCTPGTRFWVSPNGEYQEEGQKQPLGNIWGKASWRFLYPLFSLPTPNSNTNASGTSKSPPRSIALKKKKKMLLVGLTGSGTSAICKQAKWLFGNGNFTSTDKQELKLIIQCNIYKYITVLLEAREQFEEEEKANQRTLSDDASEAAATLESVADQVEQASTYVIDGKMKDKADWFLDIMANGQFDTFFPAATREYASVVEEMWKHPAIQATYKRRPEIHLLPDVAEHFLDRVVEISSNDYSPSDKDILYAEGINESGLLEFEFHLDANDSSSEADALDEPLEAQMYHLIRINSNKVVDGCKWLDMFEDTNALIFCVALDTYDQMWWEGSMLQNKMMLSRDLFAKVIKYASFRDKSIILLFNKYDAFTDKVHQVPLTVCEWFSDFAPVRSSRPNLAQQAYPYVAHKFKEYFRKIDSTGRKLFTFKLTAWERQIVRDAFYYIHEVLKWKEFTDAGLLCAMEESWYASDYSVLPFAQAE